MNKKKLSHRENSLFMCGGFLVYNEKQRLWVRRRYVKQKVGISRNHGTWGNIFAGRMWRKKRAAHEYGLGTVIMGVFDESGISSLLDIPKERELAALIALGYPDIEPSAPKRKTVEDLLQYR